MIKPFVLFLAILLPFGTIKGQCDSATIDRLNESLLKLDEAPIRADTLNELAYEWKNCDLEKALVYADSAESLSQRLSYLKGVGDNYMIRGLMAEKEANLSKADTMYHRALKVRKEIGIKINVAKVYNNLGALYTDFGRTTLAVPFYKKGLAIFKEIQADPKSDRVKARIHNNLGMVYNQIGLYELALENFEESLEIRKRHNDRYGMANTHLSIGTLFYEEAFMDVRESKKHLEQSLTIFEEDGDVYGMARCYLNMGNLYFLQTQIERAYRLFRKALDTGKLSTIDRFKAIKSIGSVYYEREVYQTAIDTFTYCLENFNALDIDNEVAKLNLDIGRAHYKLGNYEQALEFFKKSISLFDQVELSKFKIDALRHLSYIYNELNQLDEAFHFSNESIVQEQELKKNVQEAINYRVKLSEEKKKLVNSKLQLAELENKNMLTLASLVFGVLLTAVGFWTYSSRKKHQLAEKQRQLAENKRQLAEKNATMVSQKVDVLIKEQALNTTLARLEGIEEERKRIAQELHDQIGAMLSTAKLYFAPMDAQVVELDEKDRNKYQKATRILDEAYTEVRRISHNMASPSLTKLGLVGELQLLVKRIKDTQKLDINVDAHGMQERLDNNIEIKLYAIVQEVITNALKHARSSEINIQLNHFGDLVNVMIEDNGIGFDYERSKLKKGMGLNNIRSRVKDLNGTFEVDSGQNRGTTITIDIPL